MRALWSHVLDVVVSNTHHWVGMTDDYFTPVNLPSLAIQDDDIEDFKFYGFLIRQTIFFGFDLLPISPFLLALILTKDLTLPFLPGFIEKVGDTVASRLSTWPPIPVMQPNGTTQVILDLSNDPMRLFMESDILQNFQVCSFLSDWSTAYSADLFPSDTSHSGYDTSPKVGLDTNTLTLTSLQGGKFQSYRKHT